ncbi:unnamed protein product, partial [Amoebophrya sp. A120]
VFLQALLQNHKYNCEPELNPTHRSIYRPVLVLSHERS